MSSPSSPAARRRRFSSLVGDPGLRLLQHLGGVLAPDDADAVVVAHHNIAGLDRRAGAHHRDIHRAGRPLHCALGAHRLRPDRETHRCQILHVAHAGVGHQAGRAAGPAGGRQQVAEIAGVGRRSHRQHQHVAGLKLFDGDMDHPVVARRREDGDRRTRRRRAGIDRPHGGSEQPAAPLRLVDRGDAAVAERRNDRRIGPLDIPDDDIAHRSSSTQRGNMAWKPSAYLQSRPPAWPPELRRKWLPRFSATLV